MIVGTGVDIVEIDRIKAACLKNPRFLERIFTEAELEYANRKAQIDYSTLASMWASKEAYAKATGKGFRGFGFKDVEVKHKEIGAPYLILHHHAAQYAENKTVHLSISHSDISAIAFCIIEQ